MASGMPADREVEAIRLIVEAFEALDGNARRRVHRWFVDRYGNLEGYADEGESQHPARENAAASAPTAVSHTLVDLEALYAAAKTTAQWERALITGYWLQEVKRQADFDAMAVNQAMRQCGYGISNITRELAKLTDGGLVVVQPSPSSSKGRRRFRVSREGLRWCRRRLGQLEA